MRMLIQFPHMSAVERIQQVMCVFPVRRINNFLQTSLPDCSIRAQLTDFRPELYTHGALSLTHVLDEWSSPRGVAVQSILQILWQLFLSWTHYEFNFRIWSFVHSVRGDPLNLAIHLCQNINHYLVFFKYL